MNTFLTQFYDIPVDQNSLYLQRIFADNYHKFVSNFKSVKKMNFENIGTLKGSLFSDFEEQHYYLYDLKEQRFIFSINKFSTGEVYASVEYLDKEKDQYQHNQDLPYKIIYHETIDKNLEYHVNFYWHDGREIEKHYVVLKYNRSERVLLKRQTLTNPKNFGTDKAASMTYSIYNNTCIWFNKNKQRHRLHGPAEIVNTKNNTHTTHKYWYQRNKLHRINEPSILIYDLKNRIKKKAFYYLNEKHNMEGPAEFYYNYKDCSVIKIWYQNDQLITTDKTKI